MKQNKERERRISIFRRLHSKPSPSRANSTSLRSRAFVSYRYFREQGEKGEKFIGTTRGNLYAVGGTWWYMDLFTNHPKPSLIGQKHSHCLRTTQTRLCLAIQAANYRGNH